MPSAIVTGATGILGREILFELAKDQKQWTKIHAISRSQKEKYPSNVAHDHADLTGSAEDLAKQLKGVEGEYLFFAAYLQKDMEQAAFDANVAMLKNFLDALALNGVDKKLKRVVLTTGAKQFGVHLGPAPVPMTEDQPWLTGSHRPANFYYGQQDLLKDYGKKVGFDWVVTYPNDVIGFAKGNFMNLCTSLGIYAAVTVEMGAPFYFPGSPTQYIRFDTFTSARLHARFNRWAALEPSVGNQAFNVVNGEADSWQELWPKVAARFGGKVPADQFTGSTGFEGSAVDLEEVPPYADNNMAARSGLEGKIARGKVEQRIDLVKWSNDSKVKEAWGRLAEREGLEKDAFEKATWAFLGFVLGRNYDTVSSMRKARSFGWVGYADTASELDHVFDELVEANVLPKSRQ